MGELLNRRAVLTALVWLWLILCWEAGGRAVLCEGGAQQHHELCLTFLEDLRPVDPDKAGVGILVFLAVAHVGQLGNRSRREKRRWCALRVVAKHVSR